MRKTLSVAIITQDEEVNLERALAAIAWADEVVIVDSGSRDNTEDIARRFNARFYDEEWKGFAAQKNSALEKCTCDWVLSLNADETLSDGLAKQIQSVLKNESALDGYAIARRSLFLGRRMRFGGSFQRPKLKMFRRGSAEFEHIPFHEKVHFVGKAGVLKGHLVQNGYPTLYAYIEHMDSYTKPGRTFGEESSEESHKENLGIVSLIRDALLDPAATFLYNYVLRLGFLDGREGLLLHMYRSVFMSWKYAQSWEKSRNSTASSQKL